MLSAFEVHDEPDYFLNTANKNQKYQYSKTSI
jgi:hypothetical protein